MKERDIERLSTTPVLELNIGSVSARRAIKRAGFDTLSELFKLSEKEIDSVFDWKTADLIIDLREKYLSDSLSFAANALRKREIDKAAIEKVLSETRHCSHCNVVRENQTSHVYIPGDGPVNLPVTPFSDELKVFEKRAVEIFDELDDMFESVMVYQAFEGFSTELDDLSDAFGKMFSFYKEQPRAALNLINRHLRNAFIVYVANRARLVYDGNNLWGNFFDGLNIQDSNVQGLFKQIFVEHIKRRSAALRPFMSCRAALRLLRGLSTITRSFRRFFPSSTTTTIIVWTRF